MDGIDEWHANSPAPPPAPLALTVASASELGRVRVAMRNWLRRTLPDNEIDEVLLAGGEALANAIEHGQVPIAVTLEWVGRRNLQLRVADSGAWRVTGETTTRGLGIPIMTALMDTFTVDTTEGTAIRLSRQFEI